MVVELTAAGENSYNIRVGIDVGPPSQLLLGIHELVEASLRIILVVQHRLHALLEDSMSGKEANDQEILDRLLLLSVPDPHRDLAQAFVDVFVCRVIREIIDVFWHDFILLEALLERVAVCFGFWERDEGLSELASACVSGPAGIELGHSEEDGKPVFRCEPVVVFLLVQIVRFRH